MRVTVAESVFYDNSPKNLIPSSITPADQFNIVIWIQRFCLKYSE